MRKSREEWIARHSPKRRRIDIQTSTKDGMRVNKFLFHDEALAKFLGDNDSSQNENKDAPSTSNRLQGKTKSGTGNRVTSINLADRTDKGPKDGLSQIFTHTEIAVEVGKHVAVEDILTLYCVSRDFHISVRSYLLSSILAWIGHRAPEAGRAFPFKIYLDKLVADPEQRTLGGHYPGKGAAGKPLPASRADEVRVVPGLRYLQMVLVRDRCCREMVAMLARSGHRLPRTVHGTLLRLWVLMDLPTSFHRRAVLRCEAMWPDVDVYNAQLFFVKLAMHSNDPFFGPGTNDLVRLMLGQKGLYPLWQLLMHRKYVSVMEVIDLKTRYDLRMPPDTRPPEERHKPRYVNDVPEAEVGIMHKEGWGTHSKQHLMRPDELIPLEAVERGLNLRSHLRRMVDWGHIDYRTGANLVPTEEEMYISDEERALAHMDTTLHWKKKHAQKKRWSELTPQQQQEIKDDDEDERLRLLAWAGQGPGEDDNDNDGSDADEDSDHDSETYNLNDEIDRGFILPDAALLAKLQPQVPKPNDEKGWGAFIDKILLTAPPINRKTDSELRNQSIREHLNLRKQEQKEDLRTWHEWLKSPNMVETIKASLRTAARDPGEAEASLAARAEAGPSALAQAEQNEGYDGDVEMEEN